MSALTPDIAVLDQVSLFSDRKLPCLGTLSLATMVVLSVRKRLPSVSPHRTIHYAEINRNLKVSISIIRMHDIAPTITYIYHCPDVQTHNFKIL